MSSWYVYIVECKDKKLYVGIAKDLNKRIERHNKGLACRFTKYRRPVRLVYKEAYNTKSEARNRELEIKGYSRQKKIKLIDLRINNENNEILSSMTVIARRHKVPTKQSQKREIASLCSQ
jgi:putative endonuclease